MTALNPGGLVVGGGMTLLGLGVALKARDYEIGTAATMGPGYFPALLGGLLVVMGGVIAWQCLPERRDLRMIAIAWRPLLLIAVAILAFAATIERFGFVVASLSLVLIAGLAGRMIRPAALVILAAGLTAAALAIFVAGLGMTLRIWPI